MLVSFWYGEPITIPFDSDTPAGEGIENERGNPRVYAWEGGPKKSAT